MAMEFETIAGTESSAAPRSRRDGRVSADSRTTSSLTFLTPCRDSTTIDNIIIGYIRVLICLDEHSYRCILSPVVIQFVEPSWYTAGMHACITIKLTTPSGPRCMTTISMIIVTYSVLASIQGD